jgi:hypothetical protein
MRFWKTAAAFAVIGAIAAPVVAGTWQPRPNEQVWRALTAQHRADLLAKMESSKNCRYFETQVEARDVLGLNADSDDVKDAIQCHREQDALRDGGEMQSFFSLPRYLAVNSAVALASALAVLALAIMLPALMRRTRWRAS